MVITHNDHDHDTTNFLSYFEGAPRQVMLNSVPANGTLTLSTLDAQGRGSETELAKSSATDVDQTLGAGHGAWWEIRQLAWHG